MKVSTLLNVLPKTNNGDSVLYDVCKEDGYFVTGLKREDLERDFLNREVEYILPCEDYAFYLAFEIYLKGDY